MIEQATLLGTLQFDLHDWHFCVEWKSAPRWRNFPGRGDYPSTLTQCNLIVNGFTVATAHSYRHSDDVNNPDFAMKLTMGKVFKSFPQMGEETRKKFWDLFFQKKPLHK